MTQTYNTYDAVLAIAEEVFPVEVLRSVLTGNKVDAVIANLYTDDNVFVWGTFVYHDDPDERMSSDDAGNKYSLITAFDASTGTFTLSPDITGAAGKEYSIIPPGVPLGSIFNAMNAALLEWGEVPYVDDTSLDTVTGQTEYTLPFIEGELAQVWLPSSSTTDDRGWVEHRDFDVFEEGFGNAPALVFASAPEGGKDIRLVYRRQHPRLPMNLGGGLQGIHRSVPLRWLVVTAAEKLARDIVRDGRNVEANMRWLSSFHNAKKSVDQKYVNKTPRRKPRRLHVTPRRL